MRALYDHLCRKCVAPCCALLIHNQDFLLGDYMIASVMQYASYAIDGFLLFLLHIAISLLYFIIWSVFDSCLSYRFLVHYM